MNQVEKDFVLYVKRCEDEALRLKSVAQILSDKAKELRNSSLQGQDVADALSIFIHDLSSVNSQAEAVLDSIRMPPSVEGLNSVVSDFTPNQLASLPVNQPIEDILDTPAVETPPSEGEAQ